MRVRSPRIVPSSMGRKSKKSVRSVWVASDTSLPFDRNVTLSWIHRRLVVFPHRPGP